MTAAVGVLRSADGPGRGAPELLDKLAGDADADVVDQDAWETTNLLTVSPALADAAALREETRGSHWREDFPERDDAHWPATSTPCMRRRRHHARRSHPAAGRTDGAPRDSPARRTSSCPTQLVDELAAAGLDPDAVHAAVVGRARGGPAGRRRDVTSAATIPAEARGAADFGAREPGVVAGLGVAALVFHYVMGDDGRDHRPGARRHPGRAPATS